LKTLKSFTAKKRPSTMETIKMKGSGSLTI
jgi:hypothetical protein